MKKSFVTASVLVSILTAVAETNVQKKAARNLTPEERAERVLVRTGGKIAVPGSGKGYVAIINKQTKVPASEIVGATESIRKIRRFAFKFEDSVAAAKGASMLIRLVDEPSKPVLVVAPEESWAEINVANIVSDLTNEAARAKFLPQRTRKEILRGFAFAAGAGGTMFKKNILDIISTRDLDYCGEFIPMDALDKATRNMARRGLKCERLETYREACEGGWAPAPTNKYQQAIWKEVHEIPSEPIQIKNEKK